MEIEDWCKITFGLEYDWMSINAQVISRAMTLYNGTDEPKGFGLFSGGATVIGQPVLYLSPVATRACWAMVRAFKGQMLKKSDIEASALASGLPVTWIAGDPDCKDWFQ